MGCLNFFQKTLWISLLFLSNFVFAQPGERFFYPTQASDTIWKKNKIIVVNASKDTIEICGFKNGMKSGKQLLFYPNKMLKSEAKFKQDLLHGIKKEYSTSGVVLEWFTYKKGKKDGKYKLFYADGLLKESGKYQADYIVGNKKSYNNNGQLVRDENFIVYTDEQGTTSSVLNGRCRYYYHQGKISQDFYYKNGQKTGLAKEYHPNNENSLKSEVEFLDNRPHGRFAYYDSQGYPERTGIFYQEIHLKDTVLKNIYDGENIFYQSQGIKQRVENWKNYKRNGAFETYQYRTGQLSTRSFYFDNLKSGLEQTWDQQGNLAKESHYEIREIDGHRVSHKVGIEKTWENNILRAISEWENDSLNGLYKTFYKDGSPEQIAAYKGGFLHGKKQVFYENGQLKQDYTYKRNNGHPILVGWNQTFDEQGRLKRKTFADKIGKEMIIEEYDEGYPTFFRVRDGFDLTFTHNGQPNAFRWLRNYSAFSYGFSFYRNGTARSVAFKTSDYSGTIHASLTQTGQVFQINSNSEYDIDTKLEPELAQIAQAMAEQVNPTWFEEDLIKAAKTDGQIEWNYANGKPFLKIGFKNNLPEGQWLLFDAISNDTLVQNEFKQGYPIGKAQYKNSTGNLLYKAYYYPNHQLKESYLYDHSGVLINESYYDEAGNKEHVYSFFASGGLKSMNDYRDKTSVHLDEAKDTISSNLLEIDQDSIRVVKSFYSGNRLKTITRTNIHTGLGFVEGFHENRKRRSYYETKNDKMHGLYERFDEKENLLSRGYFTEGKRDGEWINFHEDGSQEILFYDNGELVIKPEDLTDCQCYDRTLAADQVGFAQSLEYLTPYKKLLTYLPDYLVPVDSLNYDKIFYVQMQFSNGYNDGFTRMKLLPSRELAFNIPYSEQVKINLTPCPTPGYLNNISGNFSYSFRNKKSFSASLDPKRIAISLNKNPLKSLDDNEFTGYFDVETIYFHEKEMEIKYAKETNFCFTPGKISDFIDVKVLQAIPRVDATKAYWFPLTDDFPLMKNELEKFYGFEIKQAELTLTYETKKESISFHAVSEKILAGSNFVAAQIKIENISVNSTGDSFYYQGKEIELKALEQFLESKGFYRIALKYDEKESVLNIQFYTEI